MPSDSPFLLFKVECPICKTINEFEQIKVGAYTEGSRDTDFCPQDIQWRFPRYQACNPLLYFTATCSNCFYTREFTNSYREWKSDNAFRTYRLKTVKTRHLEELSTSGSVVRKLGEAIDPQRYPNESAIIKMMLAAFDEQLAEHSSNLDMGRYYLRMAWVFRDLLKGDNPNQTTLSGLLREMDNRYFSFKSAVDSAREQLDSLNASVIAQFEVPQIPVEIQAQMLSHRDQFEASLQAIATSVTDASQKTDELKQLLEDYRAEIMGKESADGERAFGEFGSFAQFLGSLGNWHGIVTSEREALEKAISYYKQAFGGGHEIAQGTPQIQASYLIAELSRRIGDYDEAKKFFTSTIKAGQDFIYRNRRDQSRTQLARKILELAIEQGRANLAAAKSA